MTSELAVCGMIRYSGLPAVIVMKAKAIWGNLKIVPLEKQHAILFI